MNSYRIPTLLLFVAIIGNSHGCKEGESLPIVVRHDVVGWPSAAPIVLRYTDNSCTNLLLNVPDYLEKTLLIEGKEYRPTTPVIKFSKRTASLVLASPDDWERSTQEVASPIRPSASSNTLSDGARGIGSIVFRRQIFAATCSGSPLEARGRAILSINGSPDGKYASILSAEGKPSGGLPFMKNDRAKGTHFVEFWDARTCQRIGQPFKIDRPEGVGAPSVCWAADSRLVVIVDAILNRYAWFVPVPPGELPTESAGKDGE